MRVVLEVNRDASRNGARRIQGTIEAAAKARSARAWPQLHRSHQNGFAGGSRPRIDVTQGHRIQTEQRERSPETRAHRRHGTAARKCFTLLSRHGPRVYAIGTQIAVVY